jgi:Brp/Blh family beta-carotene 15,15'-monooxygenase|tara:strand:- start:53 stop:946 length:894 start_codon:yes stop_codon:yes gene_type:complete
MNNLYIINKNLSLIFFFFCLICLPLIDPKADTSQVIQICFFLIITVGVSHGSLDHLKGYQVLKFYKIKSKIIFYISYIFFSFVIIFLWIIFPLLTLSIFLLIASYHFGKEDSEFGKIKETIFKKIFFFLKGSIIILAPLWFNPEETLNIFEILNVQFNNFNSNFILILLSLSVLSNFFINENFIIAFIDSFSVILLNLTFTPLVAFTLYFCFLHSVRHSISLIKDINSLNFIEGFKNFAKKALPLTLITTILFLIGVYILTNYYVLNDAILNVIFIGLASLTFPHILLEYIVEKNEK